MDNDVRELLRDIAEDIPPQQEVPPTLRPRARRRTATTLAVTVVVVGALAFGGVVAVRSITESSRRPADTGPTPLGAGQVLTVMNGDLVAQDPASGEVRTIVDTESLPRPDPAVDFVEVTGAAWSPDRRWVAFRWGPGSRAGDLWVADTVGGAPRQLTTDFGGALSPWAWSPTEDQLVVVLGHDVTLIDAATGRATDLGTTVGTDALKRYIVHTLVWSPDGTRIVYDGGPGSGSVYSIDVESGEHSLLVGQPAGVGGINDIDWSPDGAHVAISYFASSNEAKLALYLASADGSDLRLVDHIAARQWPVWHPGLSVGTAWSPDGTRLAYTSRTGPDAQELQVWTVSVDGTPPSLITSQCCVSDGGGPVWSPDGSQIAFVMERGGGSPGVYLDHMVVNADGTGDPGRIEELTYLSWDGGWYFCFCYG